MHVAVLIVGYRNLSDIKLCLAGLAASSHSDFEVVICENGGQGAFAELKAGLAGALPGGQPVQLICASHNLGYAGGLNRALGAAPLADAWWILNPDTEPETGALNALVERLSEGECDAVGGALYLPNGTVQSYGGRWQPWLARAVSLGYGTAVGAVVDAAQIERSQNYLSGASMLVSRAFLETVGLLREDYFLYCEEVEWCLRGLARGMRLGFAEGCRVLHYQGTSTGNTAVISGRSRTSVYLSERNQLLVTWDCFHWRLPVVAPLALVVIILRFGRRRAWREMNYALTGWWAGLRGLRGKPDWLVD